MKKRLALVLTMALCASLVGCGTTTSSEDAVDTIVVAESSTEETIESTEEALTETIAEDAVVEESTI